MMKNDSMSLKYDSFEKKKNEASKNKKKTGSMLVPQHQ